MRSKLPLLSMLALGLLSAACGADAPRGPTVEQVRARRASGDASPVKGVEEMVAAGGGGGLCLDSSDCGAFEACYCANKACQYGYCFPTMGDDQCGTKEPVVVESVDSSTAR